jgi:hypothetical protein
MKNEFLPHIEKYVNETEVKQPVHDADFIFQFLIENKVFKSKHDAIRYYFYDGQKSAKQLMALLSTYLKKEISETTLLGFAPGYGCVTMHLVNHISLDNLVCSDIHLEANEYLSQTFGVETIPSGCIKNAIF